MSVVAAIQMCSGGDVDANLNMVAELANRAVSDGATAMVLPENFALMPNRKQDLVTCAHDREQDIDAFLSELARQHSISIVAGSFPAPSPNPNRILASCRVYAEDGECQARYDKVHLFDVVISEQESYCESDYTAYGGRIVATDTSFGRVGLTICYDMRFPELYRILKQSGVDIYTVPSAFTVATGRAHWEVLLRARAIENLAWVIAPAQVGRHSSGRETYGHSLIINPWGKVVASLTDEIGFCLAEIELTKMTAIRERFPALEHQRIQLDTGQFE